MKLLGTILNGRLELDTPTDLPEGTRMVSLQFEDWEDSEHPYPMPEETWDEHIADLLQRIADLDAGVPGMTVDQAFAALDAEMGWIALPAGELVVDLPEKN